MRSCLIAAVMLAGMLTTLVLAGEAPDLKARAKIVTKTGSRNELGPVYFGKNTQLVIRTAEELVANSATPDKAKDPEVQKTTTQALAKLFEVDAIDWSKQMVVGIQTGPTTGFQGFRNIEFVSMIPREKALVVRWRAMGYFGRAASFFTPKTLALIERFEGEVKFEMVPEDKK